MTEPRLIAYATTCHELHNPENSDECPQRVHYLLAALQAEPCAIIEPANDLGIRPIAAVHTARLIDFQASAYERFARLQHGPLPAIPDSFAVREAGDRLPQSVWGQLGYFCTDATTPILERTWDAAYWSAQTALSAAQAIANGATLAYALCRPPGHHASADLYGGYCYLNNAAIAAEWLAVLGRRVAILDTDYHHGNGTQSIFYERADVFTVSLHADPDEEYPYFTGYAAEQGAGAGTGYNVNIPIPVGTDEVGYLAGLDQALAAVVDFDPDVVVVAHGFDTVDGDPHGTFRLKVDSYEAVGRRLRNVGRPLVLVQEGGYLLPVLKGSLNALLTGLLH